MSDPVKPNPVVTPSPAVVKPTPTSTSVVKEQVEQEKAKDTTPSGVTVRKPDEPKIVTPTPEKTNVDKIPEVSKEKLPSTSSEVPNYNSRVGLRG